jgi:hypothetical protein
MSGLPIAHCPKISWPWQAPLSFEERLAKPFEFFIANFRDHLTRQMSKDIEECLSKEKQMELQEEIEQVISQQQLKIQDSDKHFFTLKALATYGTSLKHYAPLLIEWVESLLDTAVLENRKLIFLARDGIPPYEAALILKAKNKARYGTLSISLLHLSRTLVYFATQKEDKISLADSVVKEYALSLPARDPELLKKYINQETGLKEGDKCLFVDIGFAGSMIPFILNQCPDIDAKFCFLISHTKSTRIERYRAWGFLAHSEDRPLEPVNKAGKNPAVHWLEDTHQFIFKSPKILIQTQKGLKPATVKKRDGGFVTKEIFGEPPRTCRKNGEQFLVKWFGFKALIDAVKDAKNSPHPLEAWRVATEERRGLVAGFLSQLHSGQRLPLIKH